MKFFIITFKIVNIDMKLKRYIVLTKFKSRLEVPPMISFMAQTSWAIGCFVIQATTRQVRAVQTILILSKN